MEPEPAERTLQATVPSHQVAPDISIEMIETEVETEINDTDLN